MYIDKPLCRHNEIKQICKWYRDGNCILDISNDKAPCEKIEAFEKQIPKQPIIWENRWYFSPTPNDDWGYECPCCGNREIDYPEHHCACGQALDWKDFYF